MAFFLLPVILLSLKISIIYSTIYLVVKLCRARVLLIPRAAIVAFLLLLAIFFLSILSSFSSSEVDITPENFKYLFYSLAIVAGSLTGYSNVYNYSRLFVVIVVVISVAGYILNGNVVKIDQGSLVYLPDQNSLAILISFLIPVVIPKDRLKESWGVALIIFTYFVVVNSRAGLIFLIVYILFITFKSHVWKLVPALIGGTGVVYIAYMLGLLEGVLFIGGFSDSLRLEIWAEGIEYFLSRDNYFLGYGGGDFQSVVDLSTSHNLEIHHAHNLFLEVLISYGFIAMLFQLLFFLYL